MVDLMPVLGSVSPIPRRLVLPASTTAAFPDVPGGTYNSPDGAIIVPAGALDRWYTYRATGATSRRDVPVFGDSTTYGSGANYSWLQRLRDRLVDAGLADAGKGFFAGMENEIGYDSPEVNGFISTDWGGGVGDVYDLTAGQFYFDTGSPVGHTLSLRFIGTGCRIWFSIRSNAGSFTYTIDGGIPVTVLAGTADNPGLNGPESRYVTASGLADGLHTVVITNLGGPALTAPPTWGLSTDHSAGTLPADTTYRYAVTTTSALGESLPSATKTVTTEAGFASHQNTVIITSIGGAATGYNIYRAPGSSGGTFLLVGSVSSGGTFTFYFDTGADTPALPSPPLTSTAGANLAQANAYVALGGFRQSGVGLQKYATSGGTMANFTAGTQRWWDGFGLTWTMPDPTLSQRKVASNLTAFDETATALAPVLAILDLGFNDLSSSEAQLTYEDGIAQFAAGCQAAECDGIVMSGQLPYNAQWAGGLGATTFATLRDTAADFGLVFIDMFVPVGGPSLDWAGGTSNPHLTRPEYEAQADYLWDNLLGLTA